MHTQPGLLRYLACVAALLSWAAVAVPLSAAPPLRTEGIAIAIVYDTSGSMRETVRAKSGNAAKFMVANAALKTLAAQIEKFVTNQPAASALPVSAGLFVFDRNSARQVIAVAPFNRGAFDEFTRGFSEPSGNTPLGNSVLVAGQALLTDSGRRKHLVVITDGKNTVGSEPSVTLPRLREQAAGQETSVAVHFVAFDVDARIFDPIRKQGATVVSAADEKQLNSQLDFILQKKILLEDEDK
jgi:hypothetical protein